MARAGGGGNELHYTAKFRNIPPLQAAGAQHFAMDAGEDVGEAPAAGRPAPLLEVLPQERVQQRTAEQIVDPVPVVPLLHAFVPQMVESLVDILAPLDFRVAEQVIEVPKIVCPPRRNVDLQGFPPRQSSTAPCFPLERISEQTVEQIVDIPVSVGGLQDFRPGQSSSSVAQSPAAWLTQP